MLPFSDVRIFSKLTYLRDSLLAPFKKEHGSLARPTFRHEKELIHRAEDHGTLVHDADENYE